MSGANCFSRGLTASLSRLSRNWLPTLVLAGTLAVFPCCYRGHASESGTRYEIEGTVVHIEPKLREITIAHKAIPGYMDAMVMPFKVRDEWPFSVAAVGNSVRATLVVSNSSSWLEDVVLTDSGREDGSGTESEGSAAGTEVPDFRFINQDGKRISLSQYRGKALLLTFIYTRCPLPDYCALMSDNFAQIDKKLSMDPLLFKRTHLLSISFDAEHDTPAVLRSYGAAYTERYSNETFAHWEFATSTADEIKRAAAFFGLSYLRDGDQIVHSLRTVLIRDDGRIGRIYSGNDWKPGDVVEDIRHCVTGTK